MSDLDRILDPGSIAIAGLSADPAKHGGRVLGHLRRLGYEGEVWGVNPRLPEVDGIEVHPTVADLPRPPDLVVCAIPAAAVSDVALDSKGVGGLVVFAGGFAESGPDGEALEVGLTEQAASLGFRVLGPNSGGVIRPSRGLAASFLTCLDRPADQIRTGRVGLVTQSGGTGSYLHNLAAARGSGLAVSVSTGNEIDIRLGEAVGAVSALDEVKVVLALIETVRDGEAFVESVRSSLERGKPVVACRIGTGARGRSLMTTHTGAMALPERVLQGVLDSLGVVVAETPGEAYDVAEIMAWARAPAGDRVAIVTHSGGVAIHLADLAERHRLSLPQPGPELKSRLDPLLELGSANNPLDMGGIIGGPGRFADVVSTFADSGAYDLVLAVSTAHPPAHTDERVDALVSPPEGGSTGEGVEEGSVSPPEGGSTGEAGEGGNLGTPEGGSTGEAGEGGNLEAPEGGSTAKGGGGILTPPIPIVHLWMAGDQASRGLDRLRQAGAAVTEEPRAAIRAVAGLTRLAEVEPVPTLEPITGPIEDWGLPLVVGEAAATRHEAVAVADQLGYPVVVKVVSPGLAHKTEVGGVAIDLRDPGAVAAAFDRVTDAARASGLDVDGARVEPFRPGLELIVGSIIDPVFGPMVSVGVGGVLTELLDDVSFAPAPVDESGAATMIDRLRGRPLLDGYRGAPPADVDGLARVVSLVSRCVVGASAQEVELNPLVWTGLEWVAVDWLVLATRR